MVKPMGCLFIATFNVFLNFITMLLHIVNFIMQDYVFFYNQRQPC